MTDRTPTRHHLTVGAAVLSTAIGVACIVATWGRLSATIDEPNHIAAGLEWLQEGRYTLWTENPPLARVAAAIGPYLAGARLPGPEAYDPDTSDWRVPWMLGAEVLYRDGDYVGNLAQARAGLLPFFVLIVLLTGLIGARLGGQAAGSAAAILVATLPPLVGNAALATTDIAFVAMFLFATHAWLRWLADPSLRRSAILGVAVASAVLTKFTAIAFLPVMAFALLVGARLAGRERVLGAAPALRKLRLRGIGIGALVMVVAIWAGYRFSTGRVDDQALRAKTTATQIILAEPGARTGAQALFTRTALPAPELLHGLLHLSAHNRTGHSAYLLGKQSQFGFPHFYPVALFFKLPLTFLLVVGVGIVLLLARVRDRELALPLAMVATAGGILLVLVPSNVNLGVRHALVVCPLLAVGAAVPIVRLLDRLGRGRRLAVAGLCAALLGQQAILLASRPDPITYFNAFAGSDPGRILEAADLDWGQGFLELERQTRARGVDRLHVALWGGVTRACEHGLPPMVPLVPHQPVTGWVAISEGNYTGRGEHRTQRDPCAPLTWWGKDPALAPGWFRWLHAHRPVWTGSGIRLYHLPAAGGGDGDRSN